MAPCESNEKHLDLRRGGGAGSHRSCVGRDRALWVGGVWWVGTGLVWKERTSHRTIRRDGYGHHRRRVDPLLVTFFGGSMEASSTVGYRCTLQAERGAVSASQQGGELGYVMTLSAGGLMECVCNRDARK